MISAAHAGTSRSLLLARLADARRRTDVLFDLVPPAHLLERPIPERHRFLFYLGHLEAFDWNLLGERTGARRPSSPLDALFAFGIDPTGGRELPNEPASAWPELAKVRAYNHAVRRALDVQLPQALDAEHLGGHLDEASTAFLVDVAIEHRLMHAETLAYMINRSSIVRHIRRTGPFPSPVHASEMVRIPAGVATLGVDRESATTFAWDNEHDAQRVDVPEFEISRCMVTNGDYIRFIAEGGYDAPDYWTEAGWGWRSDNRITHPAFWTRLDRRWFYRSLTELIPLPLDWPVYVSHAEASAYARWAGLALPTEAQWHRAAYGTPAGEERAYPWGSAAPDSRRGNFDFRSWDPRSVDAHRDGDSAFGVRGLAGNGWEWTSTPFAPLEGFRPFAAYPGYSADFFDGTHYVLKGGSALTAAPLLRRSFRNWFQPHYPYVYSGFRCVAN
ncbi:MAG TPA: SUMF1/EgtB/PvdO family nonheme iron enzyme [Rhodanobacteraceae bacterium]|nr:SUMF1/EgtB/PvdO family nonheme iron enzyme [Rhodanobacteraceae bacterium]